MTTFDGRAQAWIEAYQRLQAAQKIAVRDRLPDDPAVHYLHAQARVYALLAQAPPEVGFAVGDWLREEEERRMAEASRRAERVGDILRDAPPCEEGREDGCTCSAPDYQDEHCPHHGRTS